MDRFVKSVALVLSVVGWSACGPDPRRLAIWEYEDQVNWERGMGQGAIWPSDGGLDVALQGPGFFQVHRDGESRLTREGALTRDEQGFIIAPGGWRVQGLDALGRPALLRVADEVADPVPTTRISVWADLAPNEPLSSSPGFDPLEARGPRAKRVELAAVDLDGQSRQLTLYFRREGPGLWGFFLLEEARETATATVAGRGELRFDAKGKLVSVTQQLAWEPRPGRVQPLTLDLGDPTGQGGTGTYGVTQYGTRGDFQRAAVLLDGRPLSRLTGLAVTDNKGMLMGTFANGATHHLGRLTVSIVRSQTALLRDCESRYRFKPTVLSGPPVPTIPGSEGSACTVVGALEVLTEEPLGCTPP